MSGQDATLCLPAPAVVVLGPRGLRDAISEAAGFIAVARDWRAGAMVELSHSGNAPHARRQTQPSAPAPRATDGKPDLTGVWMHETTTVAEVKRLFGNAFDAAIELAPPGMEIGTQHKYAFNIFADFKPEEVPLRPEAARALRRQAAAPPVGR